MTTLDKIPLELFVDIKTSNNEFVRMRKVVYTGFIPQHGMEILDTEIFFKIRTTAMAGLQTLKHSAFPLRKGKFVEGNRKITSKLFPRDEGLLRDSVNFFSNNGWEIQ